MLRALGRQLTGDERVDLAACLPAEAALAFTSQIPDPQPLTGWGFIKDLATRTGTTPAVARWDTGAVLAVICHLVGTALVDRILNQLPPDTPCCSAAPNSSRPPDSFGQDQASRPRSSP